MARMFGVLSGAVLAFAISFESGAVMAQETCLKVMTFDWSATLIIDPAIEITTTKTIAASYAKSKGLFVGLAGAKPYDEFGEPVSKGRVAVGVIVMMLAVFPISLLGASVGEHLSVRRRLKPAHL